MINLQLVVAMPRAMPIRYHASKLNHGHDPSLAPIGIPKSLRPEPFVAQKPETSKQTKSN